MDWQTLVTWIPSIIGVLGAVVAIIKARDAARSTKAAAKKSDVDAQAVIIGNLQEDHKRLAAENTQLRADLETVRADNAELRRRYDELEEQYKDVCAWAIMRGYVLRKPVADGA